MKNSAFEDWFDKDFKSIHGDLSDWRVIKGLMNIAFQAGRAYQREADAETASSMWISTDIDTDETIYSGDVGDAIREQKIDE